MNEWTPAISLSTNAKMIRLGKYLKVFEAIIGSIAIDVMNLFRWFQFSPEHSFHDFSMLTKLLSTSIKNYIPIRFGFSAFPAGVTAARQQPRKVIFVEDPKALYGAKSFLFRRLIIKFSRTNRTLFGCSLSIAPIGIPFPFSALFKAHKEGTV